MQRSVQGAVQREVRSEGRRHGEISELQSERIGEGRVHSAEGRRRAQRSREGERIGRSGADVEAIRLHLPELLLIFKARGQAFADLTQKVVASGSATLNPGKLGVKGTACLAAIVPVVTQAGANVKASVESSGQIVKKLQ